MKISPRAAKKARLVSRDTVMTLEEMISRREHVTIRAWQLCTRWLAHYLTNPDHENARTSLTALALGVCHLYEAGRVDGIREERARRRQDAAV